MNNDHGLIDLYYNDAFGLEKTLDHFQNKDQE